MWEKEEQERRGTVCKYRLYYSMVKMMSRQQLGLSCLLLENKLFYVIFSDSNSYIYKQTNAIFKRQISTEVEKSQHSIQFGSEKNLLTDGMIWGDLLRTNFLRPCSAYFSPSSKLSSTPAVLFSLVTLIAYSNWIVKRLLHVDVHFFLSYNLCQKKLQHIYLRKEEFTEMQMTTLLYISS